MRNDHLPEIFQVLLNGWGTSVREPSSVVSIPSTITHVCPHCILGEVDMLNATGTAFVRQDCNYCHGTGELREVAK